MEIIIQKTAEEGSAVGGRIVAKLVRYKPAAVLGLATGSTPVQLYREMIRWHKEQGLDFSKVTTFNLDEYVGLSADHHASYHRFMKGNLFDGINVPETNIHIPDGLTKNLAEYCAAYEKSIRDAGGIDLQVLGIGSDGHLGFNEPTSSFASHTRIKTLDEQTVKDNRRFFKPGEEVPRHVITMGLGSIMEARTCLLLAFGENKADAVAALVEGPVSAMVPATILQFHRDARIILDEAAASKLKKADYYKWVYGNKPEWQCY
ncbi:MAG: glucosamine-6-phosphate deaminase [Kiritimatiellaceae bacterium]|nr:glucosamine-6-phosphate deaminase [Kiritimatiellaceae bacterium]